MERRLLFTSTLGTLLPLCLLWGFIACVLVCLHHGDEAHDDGAAAAVEMLDNGCGPGGCHVLDDAEFAAPPRPANVPHAGEGLRACPAAPRAPEGTYAAAPPTEFAATPPRHANGPPGKLCVLRI